jgi:hypothetical protein
MCGAPKAVKSDPEGDALVAAAKATKAANADAAARKLRVGRDKVGSALGNSPQGLVSKNQGQQDTALSKSRGGLVATVTSALGKAVQDARVRNA